MRHLGTLKKDPVPHKRRHERQSSGVDETDAVFPGGQWRRPRLTQE